MSHGSDESEDYWPGYVDALTSMVQVLAFVMMLLAMAVFVLSQNVAKGAVEAIAQAAKLEVSPEASVTELTARVIELIEKAGKEVPAAEPSASVPASSPTAAQENSSPTVLENRNASSRAITTALDKPPEPRPEQRRMSVSFGQRSFVLPDAASASIKTFVDEGAATGRPQKLKVRAYASPDETSLSEARRLAYYRAMTVRTQLIQRGVAAHDIQIKIFDTSDKGQGQVTEVIAEGAGNS